MFDSSWQFSIFSFWLSYQSFGYLWLSIRYIFFHILRDHSSIRSHCALRWRLQLAFLISWIMWQPPTMKLASNFLWPTQMAPFYLPVFVVVHRSVQSQLQTKNLQRIWDMPNYSLISWLPKTGKNNKIQRRPRKLGPIKVFSM